ncbi:pimeloyl-ACP methyl ester carboxylesterase [Pseudomonas sp. JUb42]|jgi:pimeloyl-ACP methyl ester carboxylesterase|uniref:alpha/beta fold hydrolase n=1 Tax=Pseudomonas sp. JUb42 TaxID=2940611 RepID=UPI0021695BCC|nr:alpha/beta hydrolase [Pseudomonas sp. JUb42]MCS3466530.1 pimeloyl-ACP methyl ester carboxylesterase [Pseudomonas sp. JUb42]
MRPEISVLDIQGQFRVYTEFYRAEAAEKTIVMVNGSLATTASFAQTVRNLHPQFNVVLYDQPYAGKSKAHNLHEKPLTKEMEGQILLELIDHFAAEHVMSFSWGGAATLVALAHRPRRIEKAVISSFSPVINAHMRDYLERGVKHLGARDRFEVGNLVNDTIGKHLPSLFKRFNYRHVSSLDLHEYDQMHFHISEVLTLNESNYLSTASNINVPVMFMNGEWDEYTAAQDARLFGQCVQKSTFSTIQSTGHFLDMEHKAACRDSRNAVLDFLKTDQPGSQPSRHRLHQPQEQHAFAL